MNLLKCKLAVSRATLFTAGAGAIAVAAVPFTPVMADEGGMLKTVPRGTYQCAVPGDAARDPLKKVPAEDFKIGASSSYSAAEGRGTYLLRGKVLTFTSGPKRGQRYRQIGTQQLQKLGPDGALSKMICARASK